MLPNHGCEKKKCHSSDFFYCYIFFYEEPNGGLLCLSVGGRLFGKTLLYFLFSASFYFFYFSYSYKVKKKSLYDSGRKEGVFPIYIKNHIREEKTEAETSRQDRASTILYSLLFIVTCPSSCCHFTRAAGSRAACGS